MTNFAFDSFHSDDAFCALLPQVKAEILHANKLRDLHFKTEQEQAVAVSRKIRPCRSAYWIRQEPHLSSVFFTEQL